MIKFEEHEGQLFCMLEEPVPLAPDSKLPCLVRLIQDDSPMGRYNRDAAYFDVIGKLFVAQKIKENPFYSNTLHAYEKNSLNQDYCIASIHTLEIIGYPVADGSRWWALYQMMQGKKVSYKGVIGNVYLALNQDGNVQQYDMDNLAYIGTIRSKLEFGKKDVVKTGWQIYKEPKEEPKLPKEQKIDSGEKEYTCLICGKKMSGLDGRAEVSIKRISISNLYESTLSHYCGSCFLKLGFDVTEKELRSRQQPNPEPTFKVGDWVKYDIDSYLQVIEPSDKERTLCKTLSGAGAIVYPYTSLLTKVSPSEVVVHIGCLSGTIEDLSYAEDGRFWFIGGKTEGCPGGMHCILYLEMLDTPTRKLVESLLKAQEEK